MTRRNAERRQVATAAALTVPGRCAERARCAQADPDLVPRPQPARAQPARQEDLRPVRSACRMPAIRTSGADTWSGITTGIWGGTTPRERDLLRRQRTAVAA
jgi:hypothetical protein